MKDDRPVVFRPNERPSWEPYWWPAVAVMALFAIGATAWKFGLPW